MGRLQHQRPTAAGSSSPLRRRRPIGAEPTLTFVRPQVVMWLNQNFLLPEGVDTPDVTFMSLRAGGLLSINMAASGQVPQRSRLCFRG